MYRSVSWEVSESAYGGRRDIEQVQVYVCLIYIINQGMNHMDGSGNVLAQTLTCHFRLGITIIRAMSLRLCTTAKETTATTAEKILKIDVNGKCR